MKVTKELKNLINRSFVEKRNEIREKYEVVAKEEYLLKKNEIEESEEYKTYVESCKNLHNFIKNNTDDDCFSRYGKPGIKAFWIDLEGIYKEGEDMVDQIIHSQVSSFVRYNNEIRDKVNAEITAIDLAEEALLIKLTYEKNLDVVKEMLAEYDIII